MKLTKLEPLVYEVLVKYPDTRNSDDLLYVTLCKRINPVITGLSMEQALLNREALNLPKYGSVGRCRRKLQAKDKELKASDTVIEGRFEEWKAAREYALQ